MSAKPRRWFSFSLRTMFIVVTLLCCYLAWQMSIVRARQAILQEVRSHVWVQVTTAAAWEKNQSPGPTAPKTARIPLVRQWLGDEAIQEISCAHGYHNLSPEQYQRLVKAFPEAKVREHEVLMEPCHPGCFPRGTPVETPDGPRPIETIEPGDELTIVLEGGSLATAKVQSVFVTTNRLWRVETDGGTLLTTETQPLCQSSPPLSGRTDSSPPHGLPQNDYFHHVPAGELEPGDAILRCTDQAVQSVTVLNVTRTDRTVRVFNVVLGNREVFIAGGFLARSKPPPE